ncbi:hypothetical protein HK44_020670 [Pseudomonas fluorescens HK44]|uniref:Uncharacterized protein n=1 Tax=Pseudomonas fluorescens HK44 TaxID=1042209 RepID=A0A010SYM1_PSEFL|nr:hypothetical protein [Pseudomonas fluorescens]EXF95803.1 hypothetical protein HK44_020670 [Pseudomonas fluorescens HK44]
MELKSLGDLAAHLVGIEAGMLKHLEAGLEDCAVRLEQTMKAEIGHYQAGIGPFEAWADLADSTEASKAANGYPADSPLRANGDLAESFTHTTHGLETVVGSTDPVMVYHEFGTPKMPPRNVVGAALLRNKEYIRRRIGHAATSGLIGGNPIHASLGYDGET